MVKKYYIIIKYSYLLEALMTDTERRDLLNEIQKRINGGFCQVIGAGVSNVPLVRWLCKRRADVTVRDGKPFARLDSARELTMLGAKLICGAEYLESLAELPHPTRTVIFRSPGVRPDLPAIQAAVDAGAILTSEMELFLLMTPAKVIAITGSDGKTTTTTLTGMIAKAASGKRVFVGGNIGKPLLPEVENMTDNDIAVIELSSFQLQTMTHSCDTAVITNITENHLNWHHGMEEYTLAKYNVFQNGGCRRLIINFDNELTVRAGEVAISLDVPPSLTFFSLTADSYAKSVPSYAKGIATALFVREGSVVLSDGTTETEILKTDDIKIAGRHNVANYMTAIGACLDELSDFECVREIAKDFGGVPHRLEFVREHNGVKYYNSSIDSTPTRTAAALSALKEKPITICCGADKGTSFVPLAEALCARAKAVVLTGASKDKILAALNDYDGYSTDALPTYVCPDFLSAVEMARDVAVEGDTVLLSPSCTSFDAFNKFEERGDTFKKIVNSF